MIVLGLDPGTTESAIVGWDGRKVTFDQIAANDEILDTLKRCADPSPATLVIEKVESFGMAVGAEVFETVFWSGRFWQAWKGAADRMPRRVVKQHLCHTARATDANIRQALIDRFGPSKEQAFGKKSAPGPLFGITSHKLSALAVAITWADQQKESL